AARSRPAPGQKFRARDQRVLPDRDRSAVEHVAPRRAARRERVALRAAMVRGAVRAARAAPPDALPAPGDDGVLMLEPRAAYELWADTYPAVAHNPVMRAEQSVVEPVLARARVTRALDVGTGSGRYLPILQSTGARVVGVDFS